METWPIDSVRLGVLLSTASTDTVCLNSRGITLQAESRKEYEEVKILSKCYHSCMNVSAKCSAFIFCLLVDLCHQQHLQTDLSHRQSRGGRLLPFFQSIPYHLLYCCSLRDNASNVALFCFVFLGSCNQVKSDSPTGSDSHY